MSFGKVVRLRNPQVAAYGGGDSVDNVGSHTFVHQGKLLADNCADILSVSAQLGVTVEQSRDVTDKVFHNTDFLSEL